ncbi:MAG: c-type cytochrome biogenesis protein CcmI [Burkholderiaceae bacterium]
MTLFLCLAAALFVIAVGTLLRPLAGGGDAVGREVDTLREQLRQITSLHAAGALNDEQFASSRSAVERRLIDSLLPAGGGKVPARRGRVSARLAAGVAAFMLLVAAGGYWLVGSPRAIGIEPGSRGEPVAAGSDDAAGGGSPHALTQERLAAMVDELAGRLKTHPDDADGWTMLARSQVALGRHAQALQAFANAERLRPQDAQLLADHADALAMTRQRDLEGEPSALIERALKIDPHNAKALALAGTAAFDRKDYALAVRDWETLAKTSPPDGPFADQVGASIAEARRLGGLPEPAAASAPVNAGAAAGKVAGTITLAPALAGQVSPDDTLFVFARAVDGPRMPLAILRRQARDLPLDFTLDDSMAMSPSARLSGAARVVVGARISRSGNAMAQDGDLQGQAPSVAVGATGVRVEIGERVGR